MTRGLGEAPSSVVLAHYGVKGMRWGKRKNNTTSGRAQRKALQKESMDLEDVMNSPTASAAKKAAAKKRFDAIDEDWKATKRNPVREAKKEYRETVRSTSKAMSKERDASIEKARNEMDAADQRLYDAKKQYKTDRKEVGRKQAKAALIQAKTREVSTLMRNEDKAMMQTAQEQKEAVLAEIGSVAVRVAFAVATGR